MAPTSTPGQEAQEAALHQRLGDQSAIPSSRGRLDRLCQDPLGPTHVDVNTLDGADVRKQIDAQRIVRRQNRDSA